jgi:hypothetical protein
MKDIKVVSLPTAYGQNNATWCCSPGELSVKSEFNQTSIGCRREISIFPSGQVGNKLVGGDAKSDGRWQGTVICGIGPLGV